MFVLELAAGFEVASKRGDERKAVTAIPAIRRQSPLGSDEEAPSREYEASFRFKSFERESRDTGNSDSFCVNFDGISATSFHMNPPFCFVLRPCGLPF
jgi:hypothetical protein